MAHPALPSRFPIGTRFVIEARPPLKGRAQRFSRYLELPDGTSFRLPTLTSRKLARKVVLQRRARAKIGKRAAQTETRP